MNSNLEKVTEQSIGGQSMEDYMAEMLTELDGQKIGNETANSKIRVLQQMNNRHKNIIDALRVELKCNELKNNTDKGDSINTIQ